MKRPSFTSLIGLALANVLGNAACGAPPADDATKHVFKADIIVTSDPGHGMPGAELLVGGEKQAITDAQGRGRVSLEGSEGDAVEIKVACPAGYQSPSESIGVSLRRFASETEIPSFAARCSPLFRTIVVGIRAENGASLPVIYLGKEVARTDAWGAALVVLSVKPNEQVTLSLDTKSRPDARPKLRPESPTMTFVAKDKDDFVMLEQRFDIERPVGHAKSAPAHTGPTRI